MAFSNLVLSIFSLGGLDNLSITSFAALASFLSKDDFALPPRFNLYKNFLKSSILDGLNFMLKASAGNNSVTEALKVVSTLCSSKSC